MSIFNGWPLVSLLLSFFRENMEIIHLLFAATTRDWLNVVLMLVHAYFFWPTNNPCAELIVSVSHSFEVGIANAIFSCTWRLFYIYEKIDISNMKLLGRLSIYLQLFYQISEISIDLKYVWNCKYTVPVVKQHWANVWCVEGWNHDK